MENMNQQEVRAFLLHGTRTGKVTTINYTDGRPHVAPIWFTLDGDDIIFMTWHESVKAKNLQADDRISMCVDEEVAPYSFVIVEGQATIVDVDDDERYHWAAVIGGRYMGQDRADEFGKRNGVEGELVIRLTPTKIIAKKDLAD